MTLEMENLFALKSFVSNEGNVEAVNLVSIDPPGQKVDVSCCSGTAGTAGTVGTVCGCAGTFGTYGTYGCGC